MDWKKVLETSKKGKKLSLIIVLLGVLSFLGFSITEDIAEYELGKLNEMVLK